MSRDAIMVSNTTADMRVTSERAMIFSAAWRAASATNADLVTWSRSAACEMSWSVASSMRSSRRRVFVVVMVIPPPITVRDLYGNCERGAAIVRTPRARLCPRSYSRKVRQRPNASRAPYPLRPFRSPLTLVRRDLTRGLIDALRYSPRLRVCGGHGFESLGCQPQGDGYFSFVEPLTRGPADAETPAALDHRGCRARRGTVRLRGRIRQGEDDAPARHEREHTVAGHNHQPDDRQRRSENRRRAQGCPARTG